MMRRDILALPAIPLLAPLAKLLPEPTEEEMLEKCKKIYTSFNVNLHSDSDWIDLRWLNIKEINDKVFTDMVFRRFYTNKEFDETQSEILCTVYTNIDARKYINVSRKFSKWRHEEWVKEFDRYLTTQGIKNVT